MNFRPIDELEWWEMSVRERGQKKRREREGEREGEREDRRMDRWSGRVLAMGAVCVRQYCCCGSAETEGVRREETEECPSVEDKNSALLDLPSTEVERPMHFCARWVRAGSVCVSLG